MMINNRKTMQKIVATIAIFGVAISGVITFVSVAATQPAVNVSDVNIGNQQLSNNVQLPEQEQLLIPEEPANDVQTENAPSE